MSPKNQDVSGSLKTKTLRKNFNLKNKKKEKQIRNIHEIIP